MFNLIEGNVINWYKDDGYFGSSSHNTLFRNRIDWQIGLKHFSNYYNIVGNVLGTAGVNTVYESSLNGSFESSIYELGYPTSATKLERNIRPDHAARLSRTPEHVKRDATARPERKGHAPAPR